MAYHLRMMFKRQHTIFAAGYPQTTKVAAKRVGGPFNRDKDRTVVVVNGSSCFTVPTAQFQSLRVAPCQSENVSGVFGLLGKTVHGTETIAAKFGSEETAKAAFDAIVKASTGIGGSSWNLLLSSAGFVLVVFMFLVLSAIAGAVGQAGRATAAIPPAQKLSANGAAGELTIEELQKLAGKVEAPTLSCATR